VTQYVKFEVLVPNDDDGHSLGMFYGPTVPRVGDRFSVVGHLDVCPRETDEFIAVVSDVLWTARVCDKTRVVDVVVQLSEDYQGVTLYCRCDAEHLASVGKTLKDRVAHDAGDECESCGMTLRSDR
jgi:hypothetical protein